MKVFIKSFLSIFVLVFVFNLSYLSSLGFLGIKSDFCSSQNEKKIGSECPEICCFWDENLFTLTCKQYQKKNKYLKLVSEEKNLYFTTFFLIRNNSPPIFS